MKYQELRDALAASPTPGPWLACGSPGYVQAGEGHPRHTILAMAYGHDGNHQLNAPGALENGKYIAAAHPETIRALLEERDALERQNKGYEAQHTRDSQELRRLCQARDDARKERDAWKAEAEHQYELLRQAQGGGADYPTQGALDAYARGKYPALARSALSQGEQA